MLGHYLLTALRMLRKNALFSLINIVGLATGMAACLLIFLYVQWETSFDRFHQNGERIVRILLIDREVGVSQQQAAMTVPALAPEAAARFGEIEAFCRVRHAQRELLTVDERPVYAAPLLYADSTFFSFFTFELLKGDARQALAEPFSLVVTERLARQLFGDADPVRRRVRSSVGDPFTITGVCADPPENGHLAFAAVASLSTLRIMGNRPQPDNPFPPIALDSWQHVGMPTYLRLARGVAPEVVSAKLNALLGERGLGEQFGVALQPLREIHLRSSHIVYDRSARKGDATAVFNLAVVAALILVIASVNYINLSTARSADRAREVGLRKASGATRRQLAGQFLGESLVLTAIAILLALSLTELALPWLRGLTGYPLQLNPLTNAPLALGLGVLILIVGLIAGSYPALVLSGFPPAEVLKGSFPYSRRGRRLRRALVVFQFAVAIALICTTLTVNQQLHYIRTKDLGYNREHVMLLEIGSAPLRATAHALREEIRRSPHVVTTGMSSFAPGWNAPRVSLWLEGEEEQETHAWNLAHVDLDAMAALQLELIAGRNFSAATPEDSLSAIVINQAAARELGFGGPLGRRVMLGDSSYWTVIGVVRDFHSVSLHQAIEPMIFAVTEFPLPVLLVRTRAGETAAALADVERAWTAINPQVPLKYRFLEDLYADAYHGDADFARMVNAFSVLAVLIACLGLYGLAAHATAQRCREIGIRKVLGASVFAICRELVTEYLRWVMLANLLAWPVAYLLTRRWLDSFAYHIELGWTPFVVAAAIALAIALLTVLGQALAAATRNPALTLRYE